MAFDNDAELFIRKNGAAEAVEKAKKDGKVRFLEGSGELVRHGAVTPEPGLRYAMSLPGATTISGVDTMQSSIRI
jgi:hypothetical protein